MTRGTLQPTANFNGQHDAEALRKAMKGLGTDEKVLIDILGTRTNAEVKQITLDYKTLHGRDLREDLHSETSGHFREILLARLESPEEYDAHCVHRAISGAGTDEAALIEIFATRSNAGIRGLREKYTNVLKRNLDKDIEGDTSGHFKRLLISLAQGNRDESGAVDPAAAAADAQALYKAGEGKWGTDESTFNKIIVSRSFAQLKAINEEYRKTSKKDLVGAVKSEFSGWIEEGLVAVVRAGIDRPEFFAEKLYHSMKGAGTDDRTLVRIIVSRCEVDLADIKEAFAKKYGKSLASFIEGDTSGDYKKILIRLTGA